MNVATTTLQPIFEGVKQYVVPLFQRTYCWTKKEWAMLWDDVYDLYQTENPNQHFMGPIVTIPTQTVPEGVAKWLIIDGQQRLTTCYIILLVIRDIARQKEAIDYAEEISETLLVNKFKREQLDFYKLLPTQGDRTCMISLIQKECTQDESSIKQCYDYFLKQIMRFVPDIKSFESIITKKLSLVSIVLESNDDPHIVFESLNYKGKPLSSSDLIRNYFFMKIHVDEQNKIFDEVWRPMQDLLGDALPDFVRHYLMKDGNFVNEKDVYLTLKGLITKDNDALGCMMDLHKFAQYYSKLLNPLNENDPSIQSELKILQRLDMSTSYSFLLNVYNDYANNVIDKNEVCIILRTLENFAIRRFVCNVPTNQLNKVFPVVYTQLKSDRLDGKNYIERLQFVLQSKNYPKDSDFRNALKSVKLYGQGKEKIGRIILERIEQSFQHKEIIQLDNPQKIQIEHIMPQHSQPIGRYFLAMTMLKHMKYI